MYQRIVVGTDGSPSAEIAVRHALRLAKATGATVHVVTAWERLPALALTGAAMVPTTPVVEDDGSWVRELHEKLRDMASIQDVPCEVHAVEEPSPAHALLSQAEELDADLIVVGNKGMHGLRGHFASVPNTVAHKAECAVLVVPTGD
jgi:nucleotide-binding universal stress UspA family protein